jgi:RimJ/RimL family protein N-acetyltransferase
MRLLYGHDEAVERFVAERVPGCPDGFGASRSVGIIDGDGHLVAGWSWHGWNPHAGTIEFSGAAITPRWLTRSILNRLFAYAFDEIGCQMILTRNSITNTRLHRQLDDLGFTRFDVPRMFGRDEDGVFWTLTDTVWKQSKYYG